MSKFQLEDKVKWECPRTNIWLKGEVIRVLDDGTCYYKIMSQINNKKENRWVHESSLQSNKQEYQ